MTEKLKPEPAVRVKAADDVDEIYANIQRIKAEKAKELQAAESDGVAHKMAESSKASYVDYCGFALPTPA